MLDENENERVQSANRATDRTFALPSVFRLLLCKIINEIEDNIIGLIIIIIIC